LFTDACSLCLHIFMLLSDVALIKYIENRRLFTLFTYVYVLCYIYFFTYHYIVYKYFVWTDYCVYFTRTV
jgi:hypothetical protein